MRIARILTTKGARYAEADNANNWRVLDGQLGGPLRATGSIVPSDDAILLAPCEPRVVVGMANNALPEGRQLPPQAFLKSARTVIGPGESILIDPTLGATQVEAELAIVIGRTARNLSHANALEHVLGFTIGNDVTTIGQNDTDTLLTQSKHGDGYTPCGPWIETDLANADSLRLRVLVDGTQVAAGSTAGLANLVIDQLVYLTRYLTLGPGDLVLGGCPGTFAVVQPGQHVRLEAEDLGCLENPVHALAAPRTDVAFFSPASESKEAPHAIER